MTKKGAQDDKKKAEVGLQVQGKAFSAGKNIIDVILKKRQRLKNLGWNRG
jgi:hypothetical protein